MQQLRFDYRDWLCRVDPRNLVFVDEAGVHLGMTRLHGRALRGERVYDHCPRNTGQNISLLGVLSVDGLIAAMSIPGSVNTDVFITYLHFGAHPPVVEGRNCGHGSPPSSSRRRRSILAHCCGRAPCLPATLFT